jgi:hypothetical protein
MKVWFTQQASNAGATIARWKVTLQGQRRMLKTRAIAIRMQTKPTHRMIALLAFTVVTMQASGSGHHDNMTMFDMDSALI